MHNTARDRHREALRKRQTQYLSNMGPSLKRKHVLANLGYDRSHRIVQVSPREIMADLATGFKTRISHKRKKVMAQLLEG